MIPPGKSIVVPSLKPLVMMVLVGTSAVWSASGEPTVDEERQIGEWVASARSHGSTALGAAVFSSARFACLSCHRVGHQGGTIGPDLTSIGSQRTADEIAESLLWPKRTVKPEYVAWDVATDDGLVLRGYVVSEDAQALRLTETASGEIRSLPKSSISERSEIGTLMPDGLMAGMSSDERRDVLRLLLDLGTGREGHVEHMLAGAHTPATFAFEPGPLVPSQWRYAKHAVNRERIYDYYAKQAEHFRTMAGHAALLPEFPGLDGGRLGHWGNQNEDTWRDDRWNRTKLGSVMCGSLHVGERTIARGVCVRLGGSRELAVCFDPNSLSYQAAWEGGFVTFSDVRHGLLDGLSIAGRAIKCDAGPRPQGVARYRGFYRHGPQVIFAYEIDGQEYLDAPGVVDERFVRTVAPLDEHPLRELTGGGPAQWTQALETRGTLGTGRPYAIDTIEPPFENPWNALLFFAGNAFLSDGSAMLCTVHGDVWHVTGLDTTLEHVRWKRFASGLHQPLGLLVADDRVYVLGRDQITRLHDLNGDDEADFYECVSQAYECSTAGHDFVCGLERDGQGNFYTVSGKQGLLRISADGTRADVLATGFRNADGLGLLSDGSLTVPCSEGEWTATSMIDLIRPRDSAAGSAGEPPHYGYRGPKSGHPPDRPLVYLPRGLDNSAGGQAEIDSAKWGPVQGHLLHFSYGMGTYFLVLRDSVEGREQGAVVPLVGDFSSGVHRGRFHPIDGQLYVTGCQGWGTYTPADGCFERVRYTGDPVQLPIGFHAHENGLRVRFAAAIDPTVVQHLDLQFAQAWNYRYSGAYGSPEFAPSHPDLQGHDRLTITGVHVLPDQRELFLEMPELQPVNQLHLRLRVDDGAPQELYATIHALDKPFSGFPGYEPRPKVIAAHPQLADMARLSTPPRPNPWRDKLPDARTLQIAAGKNLSYTTRTLKVRAGEPLKLRFVNPDVVPHNWVLVRPGALQRVGELSNRLIADPEAVTRHYVPACEDVLVHTDVVPAASEFHIYFRAPEAPGRYPFLCTFPGHWMVMNGVLVVE